jgi:hypothetical protein
MVAKVGDVNTPFDSGLQYHFTGAGLNFYAVKADADFIGHTL